ncbi:50S ribosomal protein L19 [Brachyspira hyodysenteriae]|uniref:Large ribosomal subunit protein bL19 n=2 Tax=Brachyspira hyodysenteriae TaxID=159 RepID=RL19_BRAHW|nr:50S ribosomal protein L19 [Brachyspira hyodysenteriae]C0R1Q2.1 RecName: Full=Large ribosomal subunit protein bL19; AltName: Full=50S ribosomal protein L19 [Brachyspira hyodysenteriae WA1]ACN84040.1 50S ribosomal protein L19 [Brachyspira hyodysenteriae WA1]ANN63853.1 50S ribosomal protein L19 [Brachyspira hyodysenteriae ATCC 27164]AUJ49769.1 50S ribosomal protein L19 [Brachyspira hyodysenteriae]KLI16311.1 50S ribosomal protein L19 [Brachyspira hyodysenteriae]KLI18069.1 50S ribosomal protein
MDQQIRLVEAKYKKEAILPFEIGDTVKVWVKIIEGDRERLQAYEGTVISIRGKGINKSFIVRKISYGVGVERIFLLNSPRIDHVDIIRKAKVRRAKLYYLRNKVGKKARLVERLGVKIPKHSDLIKNTTEENASAAEENNSSSAE